MSNVIRDSILRSIRKLFDARESAGLTDAELLRRFVQGKDDAAFELLVWRHAALVVNVCRQVLGDSSVVEDAFQATFLILLQKAGSILQREALPGWLHRVAHRVALKARLQASRHVPTPMDLDQVPIPDAAGLDQDTRRLLHEEVQRLPARYRLPVICCYLEGKTHEEAAQELGWRKGTVAGRLARARELLRSRLARRGVELGNVAVAAELTASAAEAAAWGSRIAGLVKGLRGLAGNEPALTGVVSSGAIVLAEGVLSAMFWTKIKWAALVVCFVGLTGLVAGLWTVRSGVAREPGTEKRLAADGGGPSARPPARRDDPLVEVTNRALTRRNLRALAEAFHAYSDVYGHLPPAAITDKTGKPLLSWRVALLPYLNQHELYKQFKLNEPWDSPHNKKLLAKIPRVFAPVGVRTRSPSTTFYQLIVGPGAIYTSHQVPRRTGAGMGMMPPGGAEATGDTGFQGEGAAGAAPGMAPGAGLSPMGGMPGMMGIPINPAQPQFAHIFDGTANTILVIEAGMAVPWTKPEDIPYHPKKPVPKLGGQFTNVIHAAFADATVHTLPKRLDETTFRAIITAKGGEPINLRGTAEKLLAPGSAIRAAAIDRLKKQNAQLREEATVLSEILTELKSEVENLRWAVEEDRLMALDPTVIKLRQENARLEKQMRESRDLLRQLAQELRQLKAKVKKPPE